MSRVENIRFHNFGRGPEIIVDWDNDRHQAIRLRDDTLDSLKIGLQQLLALIEQEKMGGHIQ